jgi:hypothetical protein
MVLSAGRGCWSWSVVLHPEEGKSETFCLFGNSFCPSTLFWSRVFPSASFWTRLFLPPVFVFVYQVKHAA